MSAPILTFFNNKGGVGKTALIRCLAWIFAAFQKRVLVLDIDPQANLAATRQDFISQARIIVGRIGLSLSMKSASVGCLHVLWLGSMPDCNRNGRNGIMCVKGERSVEGDVTVEPGARWTDMFCYCIAKDERHG